VNGEDLGEHEHVGMVVRGEQRLRIVEALAQDPAARGEGGLRAEPTASHCGGVRRDQRIARRLDKARSFSVLPGELSASAGQRSVIEAPISRWRRDEKSRMVAQKRTLAQDPARRAHGPGADPTRAPRNRASCGFRPRLALTQKGAPLGRHSETSRISIPPG